MLPARSARLAVTVALQPRCARGLAYGVRWMVVLGTNDERHITRPPDQARRGPSPRRTPARRTSGFLVGAGPSSASAAVRTADVAENLEIVSATVSDAAATVNTIITTAALEGGEVTVLTLPPTDPASSGFKR